MASIADIVNIREVAPDDLNFFLSTLNHSLVKYIKSVYKGRTENEVHELIGKQLYIALNQLGFEALVACHRDNADAILSYLIAHREQNHIFFQYTKNDFRGYGIQKHLLLPLMIDVCQPVTFQFYTDRVNRYCQNNLHYRVKDVLSELMIQQLSKGVI